MERRKWRGVRRRGNRNAPWGLADRTCSELRRQAFGANDNTFSSTTLTVLSIRGFGKVNSD